MKLEPHKREWFYLTDEDIVRLFGITSPVEVAKTEPIVQSLLNDARRLEAKIGRAHV